MFINYLIYNKHEIRLQISSVNKLVSISISKNSLYDFLIKNLILSQSFDVNSLISLPSNISYMYKKLTLIKHNK